ncbi:MAG: hypothetical protein ABII18_13585 [bacterium]|nr:hypothetical protein [bacterium]MBU1918536.1 hypothetical protein [bacterium]
MLLTLPSYDFISAPLWLVTVLHIVTLTLHFLAMNFMVGGLAIVLFGCFKNKQANPIVEKFIRAFPSMMAATVTLGIAPLLFVQLVYAKPVYAASVTSAWFWLMIFMVAMGSYYFLYGAAFSKKFIGIKQRVYLIIALIGFVYVSFVYSATFSMSEHPDVYQALYASNQTGLVLNPNIMSYLFRWMHMLAGAVMVGGFFVVLLGRDNEQAFIVGRRFYLGAFLVSFVLGIAYLFALKDILRLIMRGPAIWILTGSIALSVLSVFWLYKRKIVLTSIALLVSFVGMVVVRHIVRLIYLKGSALAFDPAQIPFQPQWSIFIIFLVCFVLALAAVGYMFKLFYGEQK